MRRHTIATGQVRGHSLLAHMRQMKSLDTKFFGVARGGTCRMRYSTQHVEPPHLANSSSGVRLAMKRYTS